MKLKLFSTIIILLFCCSLFALSELEEIGNETAKTNQNEYTTAVENWTIIQFALFPGVPGITNNSAVYGLKLGLPMSGGKGCVSGLELSLISSTTARIYGIQLSPFVNIADSADGLQITAITNATDKVSGLQLSLINFSQRANGTQIGLVNVDSERLSGWQAGVVNYAEKADGFQLGLVNISKKNGLQLGLINIIKGGWLPFFPILNISF